MRILSSVVFPAARFLPLLVADVLHCRAVGPEFVSHQDMRMTVTLHGFSEEFQCCFAIPALRDIAFQHLALVIHGTPKVMRLAINLHKHLIQMPLPVRVCAHLVNSFTADFSGEHRAKSVPPETNCFVADVDAALMQKIFYVSQRQRKANIQHDGEADNLRAAVEIFEWVFFNHEDRLRKRPARLNSNPSDKTLTVAATMFASSASAFDPDDLQKLKDTGDCVNCDLEGADLQGANLRAAKLQGANLSDAYLIGAYLNGADLAVANLARSDLQGAYLEGADLDRADLQGANLSDADLNSADLTDGNLDSADLTDADLQGAYLQDANLEGAYLNDADLSGADLSGTNLSGANLEGADLIRTKMNGATLCNTTMPDGSVLYSGC